MELEHKNIEKYLKNKNNILLFENNNFILTNRNNIKDTFNADNFVYECINVGPINPTNINTKIKYYKMAMLGFSNGCYIDAKKISSIINGTSQAYEFIQKNTKQKKPVVLKSVVNHKIATTHPRDYAPDEFVGASHCQEGQNGNVYTIKDVTKILNAINQKRTVIEEIEQKEKNDKEKKQKRNDTKSKRKGGKKTHINRSQKHIKISRK
jgi:hypothetical protein